VKSSDRPLVEARQISVTFGKGPYAFTAVDEASLTIGESEIVGIVGETGSGKTTLARVVAGLQPATDGRLLFPRDPEGPAGQGRGARRRSHRTDIQMVFQDPYSSLDPRQTVWSSVSEAVKVRQGLSSADARAAALRLLQSIGIGDALAGRLPDLLSGGQRQRISVARALAAEPALLIADEPTSALDQSAQAQLLNLLRRIQQERQLAILFISHDLGIIRYFTDRVYVMRHGRIVESGHTEEVFSNPQQAYTQLLINSIPGSRERTLVRPAGDPAG